jgi:midasin
MHGRSTRLRHQCPLWTCPCLPQVCQLYALLKQRPLHIVNCHQHTETSDFLGGLRPTRARPSAGAAVDAGSAGAGEQAGPSSHALFEWHDGPLVTPRTRAGAESVQRLGLLRAIAPSGPRSRPAPLCRWPLLGVPGCARFAQVTAMREGHMFLLDELSLAEDAVLERLNSVLEPSRRLTLAEQGGAEVRAGTGPQDALHVHARRALWE